MRIAIDWSLCVGSGLCVEAAGPAFRLVAHGEGYRAILVDPGADDAAILAAARACPTLAIRLSDAEGPIYPPAGAFSDSGTD